MTRGLSNDFRRRIRAPGPSGHGARRSTRSGDDQIWYDAFLSYSPQRNNRGGMTAYAALASRRTSHPARPTSGGSPAPS